MAPIAKVHATSAKRVTIEIRILRHVKSVPLDVRHVTRAIRTLFIVMVVIQDMLGLVMAISVMSVQKGVLNAHIVDHLLMMVFHVLDAKLIIIDMKSPTTGIIVNLAVRSSRIVPNAVNRNARNVLPAST